MSTRLLIRTLTALIGFASIIPHSFHLSSLASELAPDTEVCAPEIQEISFGVLSTESPENLGQAWQPFLDEMSTSIGRSVNAFYYDYYPSLIEAMASRQVQVAWYGGKSYIEAVELANVEAFAQTVTLDGSTGYYSHLITHRDHPMLAAIDTEQGNGDTYVVENAGMLTFAFNDPGSTSGFLMPYLYIFLENDIDPTEAFQELFFTGSNEASAIAVANNQIDVVTNNSEYLSYLATNAPTVYNDLQVIWTSQRIPSDPIAYTLDLPDCLKNKIQNFFYNYNNAGVLDALQFSEFIPATDSDWNIIRELAIGVEILAIMWNPSLSPEDAEQLIEQLKQQLQALQEN